MLFRCKHCVHLYIQLSESSFLKEITQHTHVTFSAAVEVFDGFLCLPVWNYKSTDDAPGVYLALCPLRIHAYYTYVLPLLFQALRQATVKYYIYIQHPTQL